MRTYLWAYDVQVTPDDVAAMAVMRSEDAETALRSVVRELLSYCEPLQPTLYAVAFAGSGWRVVFGGKIEATTRAAAERVVEENSFHGASRGWDYSGEQVFNLVELPDSPARLPQT